MIIDKLYFPNQQSSTDIWHAICAAVKSSCSLANVAEEEVKGLGFAATCSLGV
jgi:ribulose kinase